VRQTSEQKPHSAASSIAERPDRWSNRDARNRGVSGSQLLRQGQRALKWGET
jgi:hypothetical protein